MEQKKHIPAIRFKGFNEEWDIDRAIHIFQSIVDKGHPELPVLTASQIYGMILRDNVGIDIFHNKKNEVGYKRVMPGQFVIHLRSFQGGFAYSSIEGITSPAYTILSFLNSALHDCLFWKIIFTSERFIKCLETVTYGIRDGRSISYDDFLQLNFSFPLFPEQQRIGSFFEKLDALISSQQTKLAKLKNIKTSLLNKMFPAKGEKVPAIRFKGFSDEWEEKKLGEICDRFDNLRVPVAAELRKLGNVPYYGANGIQDYVDGYTHFGEFILIAEDGANNLDDYPVIVVNGKIWVNNHAHVLSAKENCSNKFIALSLKKTDFKSLVMGGSRAKLNANILVNANIKIVNNLSEQQRIGSLFEKLDKLISLQQTKIDKLQNIKKAFLAKMFA